MIMRELEEKIQFLQQIIENQTMVNERQEKRLDALTKKLGNEFDIQDFGCQYNVEARDVSL